MAGGGGGESSDNNNDKFSFGKLLKDTNKKLMTGGVVAGGGGTSTSSTTTGGTNNNTKTKSNNNKNKNKDPSTTTSSFDDTVDHISDSVHQRWDQFCIQLEQKYPPQTNPKLNFIIVNFFRRLSIESPVIIGFAFSCILLHLVNITVLPGISVYLGTNSIGFNVLSPLDYLRIFTHMFGHDGIIHLRNNMTHLLLVGPSAESSFGSKVIVEVMIIVAIATSIAHMLVGKRNSRQIGASGYIFALILLNSLASCRKGKIPVSFVLTTLLWLIDEVIGLFFNFKDNTSHHGHLVGGIVGAIAGFYISDKRNTNTTTTTTNQLQQTKKKQ